MLDCEFIATGHYGIINELDGRKYVTRAVDRNKDQSYVLWGLSQECLNRTRMPLGTFTKPEVREMAAERGWDELSKKAESTKSASCPTTTTAASCAAASKDSMRKWPVATSWTLPAKSWANTRAIRSTRSGSARAWALPSANPCSSPKSAPTPIPSCWVAKKNSSATT